MKYPVLILNKDYQPFDVWPWQKAMAKWLGKDGVEPLYNEGGMIKHDAIIRDGKGNEYEIPAILILKKYVSEHSKPAAYSKSNIYARDLGVCQYCGQHVHPSNRTVDHVIPRAHWNPKRYSFKLNSFENIVTSCKPCNQAKKNRTPGQAGMKLLRQPKKCTRAQLYYNKLAMQTHIPSQWKDYLCVEEK